MTIEEAKTILEEVKMLDDSMYQYNPIYLEALDMAISALEILEQINAIIDIPNTVIQEDVMKYKMICEVMEKGGE